jgi:ribonuclease P protein component
LLPKKFKLSGFLVSQIIKKGKHWGSPFFTLRYFPLENSLFSVVVPVKVDKRAVVRNRIKRQIYEILRLNLNKFKPKLGIVILVKKEILGKSYREIEKEILKSTSIIQ